MPNVTLITYSGSLVTPQADALMNDAELSGNGMFFGGIVTREEGSATSLAVDHGIGICYGREFEIASQSLTIEKATSGSLLGRVYIEIDLNNATTPVDIKTVTGTELPEIVDNPDINVSSDKKTQFELAVFTVDTSGIVNVTQTAPQIERMPDVVSSLKSRLAELETDSGWKTIGSYIVYRVINNIVYLRVRQSAGPTRSNGYVFGTLPSGVYPNYSFAEANVYGVGRVFINQDHTVTFETSSASEKADYIQATFVYPLG